MRHTKIIATIGPASASGEVIHALVGAGVDLFRLNFSHGTTETHARSLALIRRAASAAGRAVAVLQDLGGPKLRTGVLARSRPLALVAGERLTIATGDFAGTPGRISTTSAELARAVRHGDRLLLDDGRIELEVESSDGVEILTTVVDGGELGERKGINAPGVRLPLSALTDRDERDLAAGVALGVDMVALSFVESAADLTRAREAATRLGRPELPLIAKIERPAAVEQIDSILDVADGVMIARGDLGLELPLERVPGVQKDVTMRARSRGVPVVLATQVLESMRTEPRPTRAEVSDAANAVDAGVDAIMLAGETAVGAHPGRAVETLDRIIREAEAPPAARTGLAVHAPFAAPHGEAMCEAAVTLATTGQADAIVAVTRAGHTARMLSALRPRADIFAATESEAPARALALRWGVVPFVSGPDTPGGTGREEPSTLEATASRIENDLVARGWLQPGSVVVLLSVSADLSRADANFLKLHRVRTSSGGRRQEEGGSGR